jgi:transposase
MSPITTIGFDLAKNVFQVHRVDAGEQTRVRRQLRRGEVLRFFENLPTVPRWHGGVLLISLLGARDSEDRT